MNASRIVVAEPPAVLEPCGPGDYLVSVGPPAARAVIGLASHRGGVWRCYYPVGNGGLVGRFRRLPPAVKRLRDVRAAHVLLEAVIPNEVRLGKVHE